MTNIHDLVGVRRAWEGMVSLVLRDGQEEALVTIRGVVLVWGKLEPLLGSGALLHDKSCRL